jgi:2,4-dienoyl-CoA reductase-like NADH-dependent reductase (Old Yellow Enzyme family)
MEIHAVRDKYLPLFQPLTLRNGVTLTDRLGVPPMTTFAGRQDGILGEDELDYFERRNFMGQLFIAPAIATSPLGRMEPVQYVAYGDEVVPGLTEMARRLKARGNKAVLQLQHAGRESRAVYEETGKVYAPSAVQFPFLPYPTTELTVDEIEEIIGDFGRATKRAIETGFDGVEIHGANHYLIQEFFSAYSNRRTDEWGGSLENRARFGLRILDEVKRVVAEAGRPDFIVGYRLSPEEVHGNNVGYTVDDALYLVDALATAGLDYIHTSLFAGVDEVSAADNSGIPINTRVRECIAGRTSLVVVSNIWTPDDALDALAYGDIVTLGREAIIEPEWVQKVLDGREDEIRVTTPRQPDPDLLVPTMMWELFFAPATALPPLPVLEDATL